MGATETGFVERARAAGFPLRTGESMPWLTVHGHVTLAARDTAPGEVIDALQSIFDELGGDSGNLAAKRAGALRPDAVLAGQIVEVDETQHFTSDRLKSLALYPDDVPLGYDRGEYARLCEKWAGQADRYRASKTSVDFYREGGRRAQRAYFDAVRDLLAPYCCGKPVLRIPAPERDPDLAFARFRNMVDR